MRVRKLDAEDAARFQEVRLEGLRNHPEAFGASLDDEAARPIPFVAERLSRGAVFGGFGEDGALMGVIGVVTGQSAKVRHIATIWGMYVRPSARGTGLAAQLMQVAVAEGFRNCRSIRLSVVSTNHAARRLYLKAGFREWAVDHAALHVDGVYHDEVLMRRDLE